MKLNKTKVRYILRQNRKGVATEEIARDVKVSQRRVQQIIKEYKEAGKNLSWAKKLVAPANPSLRKRQRSSELPTLATTLERECWRL